MTRTIPHESKVARRAHDPGTEVMMPDPIRDHARRQRILRARDRLGQLEPPAALLERGRFAIAQRRQESPRYFLAQILRTAADSHALRLELRGILDRVQEWILRRNLRLQFLGLLPQLVEMLFPSTQEES